MTLLELLQLLKKHLKLVLLLPVCTAAIMGVASLTLMDNTYTSNASLYIISKSQDVAVNNYTELSAAQLLATDVASIVKSETVLSGAASDMGLASLDGYSIEVNTATSSRVISLSVTGKDAKKTCDVTNAIADNVSKVAKSVGIADGVNVIDKAEVATAPSGPNRKLYVVLAFAGGFLLAVGGIVLRDMLNTRVRGGDEAERLLGIPVIGRFPAVKEGR
ncbi:MAG: Wzz/FepE/Etk N-terminal domain-containing protein [Coriobacteriaceae bacterium]|nr:Wzz/FepE/Etk N-terminal domain-containing protein [Coriobacteriaceae bacterium]